MTKPIHELIPEYIRGLNPYVPGKPIEEVERELRICAVKLASNENPLGPSPLGIAAARRALAGAHRYPDGGGHFLRAKLATRLGVGMDNILLGFGSSDLIDLSARAMLRPDSEGLTSAGSFPLFYIAIRAAGARLLEVPLKNYTFDLEAMARAITSRTRYIVLANPNNPTGTMFTADAFEQFLGRVPEAVLVVIDEAYFDYVQRDDYTRSIELVRRGANLIVLRTFSKVYGLAGMRIGYAIGPAALLAEINKLRLPFNTSGVAQAAALAALDDAEHVTRSIDSNRAGLQLLCERLSAIGVHYVPSVANFLLVTLESDARPVADELLRLGVIVRPMRWMGFPNAIRVTVGTAEENDRFLNALAQVRAAAGLAPPSGPTMSTPLKTSKAGADPIAQLLENSHTIAVVGLSSKRYRSSYGVSEYMKSAGYRIIPVNPNETEVLGEKSFARLEDIPDKVDIVDIFRRSELVPEVVESAIRIGAKAVWMQEGVINPQAAERARQVGLTVVMDQCILKEHRKRLR